MKPEQLAKGIVDAIDEAIRSFASGVPGDQQRMVRELELLLKDLDTHPNGGIKNTVANLKLIGRMKAKLEAIVLSDAYVNRVSEFAETFNAITKLHNGYFKALEATYKPFALLEEIKKQSITSTVESLTEAGIAANVTEAIQELLRRNITTGGTYEQLLKQLRDTVLTNDKGPGLLERYTRQVTTDALNQYSAQYNQAVSDDLGFEWYMYTGSNIETTREFCFHLTKKKYIHKSELAEIIKGNIDGHRCLINKKTKLPRGMIDGTNVHNFKIYRGGWQCGHQLMPVPAFVVPLHIRQAIKAAA
ncbi:MAG TPA: hypothetical protein VEY71_07055 [Chitinophagales bacterium]|nr:hypothetical protein [Chitinophagales bacterium]